MTKPNCEHVSSASLRLFFSVKINSCLCPIAEKHFELIRAYQSSFSLIALIPSRPDDITLISQDRLERSMRRSALIGPRAEPFLLKASKKSSR